MSVVDQWVFWVLWISECCRSMSVLHQILWVLWISECCRSMSVLHQILWVLWISECCRSMSVLHQILWVLWMLQDLSQGQKESCHRHTTTWASHYCHHKHFFLTNSSQQFHSMRWLNIPLSNSTLLNSKYFPACFGRTKKKAKILCCTVWPQKSGISVFSYSWCQQTGNSWSIRTN